MPKTCKKWDYEEFSMNKCSVTNYEHFKEVFQALFPICNKSSKKKLSKNSLPSFELLIFLDCGFNSVCMYVCVWVCCYILD